MKSTAKATAAFRGGVVVTVRGKATVNDESNSKFSVRNLEMRRCVFVGDVKRNAAAVDNTSHSHRHRIVMLRNLLLTVAEMRQIRGFD